MARKATAAAMVSKIYIHCHWEKPDSQFHAQAAKKEQERTFRSCSLWFSKQTFRSHRQRRQIFQLFHTDQFCAHLLQLDGCFASIDLVPTHAITLTCPTLMKAPFAFCIVPAPTKANAVKRTLNGEISTECPATTLRNHPNAILYLDGDSSALL